MIYPAANVGTAVSFLRLPIFLRCRALGLPRRHADGGAERIVKQLQVRCLPVRRDRAVGRDDVDDDLVCALKSACLVR
jgi:hypothetical protein